LVFYISVPDSEAESSNSSNPLEPLVDSRPLSPNPTVSIHEDQEIAFHFTSTPQVTSLPGSSLSIPFPPMSIPFKATVSESPHLIKLENDDAQWEKADWRSCWYILLR